MFNLRFGHIFEQLIIFSLDSLRTFVRMITVGVKAVTSGCRGAKLIEKVGGRDRIF